MADAVELACGVPAPSNRCRMALAVSDLLPQQQLVLELLRMSGEIGVTDQPQQSILWRTLGECRARGWIAMAEVSPGVHSVSLTAHGRRRIESASPR